MVIVPNRNDFSWKSKILVFPKFGVFFLKTGVCPERLVFMKRTNTFSINDKARLMGKLSTNLGPPFSHLWQEHEMAIGSKRVKLPVQAKEKD